MNAKEEGRKMNREMGLLPNVENEMSWTVSNSCIEILGGFRRRFSSQMARSRTR
jgi:hypothetical protein